MEMKSGDKSVLTGDRFSVPGEGYAPTSERRRRTVAVSKNGTTLERRWGREVCGRAKRRMMMACGSSCAMLVPGRG